MIPQGRLFYLESAKVNPKNKKWVRMCFRNYARVYKKEQAAASTATWDKQLKINYTTILAQEGVFEHELG